MRAFRFANAAEGLKLCDLPVPEPSEGFALIQTKAAGLCHSDTHVLHGGGEAWMCNLPITLGHEVSGVIAKLGDESSPFQVNDRVAVACVGHPIEERNFSECLGVGVDGGYAEYAVAPFKYLVKIPDGVDFPEAAVATDSIATAFHAVVTEGGVNKSNISKVSTVAVIGLGGLGLNGVAIAALSGAKIYGVDINTSKFDQARCVGAFACATSLSDFPGVTFDVILDFVGAQKTVETAVSIVRDGGTIVLVGLASSRIQLPTADIVTRNLSLKGSTSASIDEFVEVLELLSSKALTPQIREIPFEEVPSALESLSHGEVTGRLYTRP
ncbi:hypothetical protein FVEN_g6365 [Fusarium venenatum]|uniref:Enoyl reductase (ER) domain-containing protein n=1 Tax=Fusarium venenatum TaxID=56646 RepID=A0A2L2T5A8_9HYPO|nr:uncharacterized protein FVRRES_04617 [Fusarium venenatum]KAG8355636.1 hypothetical protein FVEN_g6365 [Fusarium venenatum]KAH6991773.1 chaperonin 10-like protein [Fusarium venenatum]CEI60181.1 unnamed protein product [Fusarium venenatum]